MKPGEYRIDWQGDRVEVSGPGGRIARARWLQGRLVERSGDLTADTSWELIEEALRLDAEQLIEATNRAAYDARGVDVTQIDRMLALSPLERLRTLDAQRRTISRLHHDARRT